MAVYFKFKSAKDFDSIPIDGHFISVGNLKERIFESKFGRGTGFDLVVANAQTNEDYLDEATLIPKNTSLLVRRVPVQRRMPIVTNREEPKVEDNIVKHEHSAQSSFPMSNSSALRNPEEIDCDEFGNDLYAIPEALPAQSNYMVQATPTPDKADEDSKIKALVDSSALEWHMQPQDGFGAGRGFGRGMGGRMPGGRGFGRGGFERTTPPQGYICHRCDLPGHFIQHCPTNGDPTFDKRRVKNPTGIPKDMLRLCPDGTYAMAGGAAAELRPNEAAFDKEFEGLSSTRSVGELPPELHCPVCKEVMKDAVLTSKCCFSSFCDKCIRNHIISKSKCVCGAINILADDLLPNKTVRETISRILESNNSSTENGGSALHIQDRGSVRVDLQKAPSPTLSATSKGGPTFSATSKGGPTFSATSKGGPTFSATSKGGQIPPSPKKDTPDLKDAASVGQPVVNPPQQSLEKGRYAKTADLSEVTLELMHNKEPKLPASASHAEEEVQQKLSTVEPGKKKKKKKTPFPVNGTELQWRTPQDFSAGNYMMPFGQPSYYDGYWGGMQIGMDGYMAPAYAGAMPYMGYTPGPFDMPPMGVFPQDPFGGQGYPMPFGPPQRNLPVPGMGREEFEARKADIRRKSENDRRAHREEFGRELGNNVNNVNNTSMKSKSRIIPQEANHNNRTEGPYGRERQPVEASESTMHRKNKADHYDEEAAEADNNSKASVFSRISFPEGGTSKKRKSPPLASDINKNSRASHHRPSSNGYHEERKSISKGRETKSVMVMDEESSDDDEEERHFKRRRPTRYEPQPVEWEEEDARAMRSSRESGRERDRGREYERQHEHRHSHR